MNNDASFFYNKFGISPLHKKLEIFLQNSIEICQKEISKKFYNGLIKISSQEQLVFFQTINSYCVPKTDAKFDINLMNIQISLHSIRILIEWLNNLKIEYEKVMVSIENEQKIILDFMNTRSFLDTRAIFQLFTGDTKNESKSFISNHKILENYPKSSSIIKYLEQKPTSKPAFIWCRQNLEVLCISNHSKLNITLNHSCQSGFIPLYFDEYEISHNSLSNCIIIENDDTAIALADLSEFHKYDLILCAGGENNAGLNFFKLICQINLSNSANWIYFGDYDVSGFKIYNEIIQNFYKYSTIIPNMPFLQINEGIYENLLILFGKPIQPKEMKEKMQKYKSFLQKSEDWLTPLKKIFQFNMKNQKELEQNLLIYYNYLYS